MRPSRTPALVFSEMQRAPLGRLRCLGTGLRPLARLPRAWHAAHLGAVAPALLRPALDERDAPRRLLPLPRAGRRRGRAAAPLRRGSLPEGGAEALAQTLPGAFSTPSLGPLLEDGAEARRRGPHDAPLSRRHRRRDLAETGPEMSCRASPLSFYGAAPGPARGGFELPPSHCLREPSSSAPTQAATASASLSSAGRLS